MTRPVLKREQRTLAFKCLCASLPREQLVHPDLLMSLEAIYGPRRCLNTADAGSNWNLDKVYLYLNHRNVYRWVRSRSEMFITLLEQRVSTNSSHCVHFSIVIWHKGEEMKHTVYLKLLLTSISVRWRMLPLACKLQFVGICLSPQRKWALFELKCQMWLRPQPNFNISLSLEDFWDCYLISKSHTSVMPAPRSDLDYWD